MPFGGTASSKKKYFVRLASVVQGTLHIERLLIINMCMVWEQRLQFNGARMCPRSYSSDPGEEAFLRPARLQ